MGPLNTAQQRDYVAGLLEQAKAAGAEVQTYGEYAGDWTSGNYMLPSLVLDPAPELGIVTEEQFGPSLPVIPYDDEAQAIRLANATWSGLCSSVWSGDTEHGMAVARQLRTGVTFFNNHNATAVDERAPFGGFNQSGHRPRARPRGPAQLHRDARHGRPVRTARALGSPTLGPQKRSTAHHRHQQLPARAATRGAASSQAASAPN